MPNPPDEFRLVSSIIAAELAAARPGGFDRSTRLRWTREDRVAPDDLGIDSLELIGVASAVSDFFNLYESGREDRLLIDRKLGAWADLAARSGDLGCTSLAFRTSGSTGEPKRIEHLRDALAREADWFAARWSGVERGIALVPPQHLYGYIHTVLVPSRLGVPVVDHEFSLRTSTACSLRVGDLVVATPAVWAELVELGRPIPPGVRGVSSGSPMPEPTWRRLLELGLQELTDIYGSTETGALGVRNQPDDAFSPVDESRVREQTNDGVRWSADGRFRLAGRLDDVVQVRGVNISTSYVEQTLRRHTLVADCAVRLAGDAPNQRLVAFVVPGAGPADGDRGHTRIRDAINSHLANALEPAARPADITFGDRLPIGPTGKVADWSRS